MAEKRNLFIVTPRAIVLRTSSNTRTLFACGPDDGIVNAKPATDNSGLIAIADIHLVLLHDLHRRKEKEYKLKSGHGEPRLLLFSPTSSALYFTTTLSPAIQAYSISTAELLSPLHAHPSPPTVIVESPHDGVLLSASPTPPTVYMQALSTIGGASIQFQPSTRSPVACAAFHSGTSSSSPACIFALGFEDGTLLVYKFTRSALQPLNISGPIDVAVRQPKELGSVKKLHKAAMRGILAIEFIPGYKSRVVSVGHDGRCRLTDFDGGVRMLRTWHVAGPATCLAITSNGPIHTTGRKDQDVIMRGDAMDEDEENVFEGLETIIAVGTESGKVFVFNVLGLLVQEVSTEAPVLALDWVGDMSAPSQLRSRQATPTSSPTSCSIAHALLREYEIAENEELGTVRKASRASSSKPLDWLPENPPGLLSGSPPNGELTRTRSKKFHPRPRIVTETFKTPVSLDSVVSSAPRSSTTVPKCLSTPTTPDQGREPMGESLVSGALAYDSDSRTSDIDEKLGSETWTTPPSRPLQPASILSPQQSEYLRLISHSPIEDSPDSSIYSRMKTPVPKSPRRRTWRMRRSVEPVDGGTSPSPSAIPNPRKRFRDDAGMYTFQHGKKSHRLAESESHIFLEDNERLRQEMQALQKEFRQLKETVLAAHAS